MNDKAIEAKSANIITPNETKEDMCKPNIPESIFRPINSKITARPFCKW